MTTRPLARPALAAVAVLLTFTLVGCGSSGPSKAELAAQDRVVIATSMKQAAHARLAAAVRAKQRQVRARLRADKLRRQRAQRRYRVIVREVTVPPFGICSPIRGGGPLSRRERREQRRQALDYLNLHC